ncbi:MAG: methyltransferase domain-containing protein [Thermoplasmata archaeon]|nr:MAG: methyltransferase domain-containing protein [Thermoplasmata archaeon]
MDWSKWYDERVAKYNEDYKRVACTSYQSMLSRYKVCLSNVAIEENMKILDIGCGTGNFEELLSRTNENISLIGLDNSSNMLKIAKKKDTSANFLKGDILRLPFKDDFLDCITCMGVLSAFNGSPNQAIKEIVRVLKLKGQLFITTMDKNYEGNHKYEKSPDDYARQSQILFVPEELSEYLESLGVKIIKIAAFSTSDGTILPLHQWDKFFIYGEKGG